MILSEYINNHKIIQSLRNNCYIGHLVECNFFGQTININDYIFNNNKVNFLFDNIQQHNEFLYCIPGPYNSYITLRLFKYDLPINFIYQLYLIDELNNINELNKRIGMWISNIDCSLCNIYEYDLLNLYIHNRLFALMISDNIQERIFYESRYENFLMLIQQLNCVLQLYINQTQFDTTDNSIAIEDSCITVGNNKLGKLININNNQAINIYQNKINITWPVLESFKGFYYHKNNFYIIYIDKIYYLCKFIKNNIYFICQFNDISNIQYINLQLNFSILSERININEYNYLKIHIYDLYNQINQYIINKERNL